MREYAFSRRDFMRTTVAGVAAGALGVFGIRLWVVAGIACMLGLWIALPAAAGQPLTVAVALQGTPLGNTEYVAGIVGGQIVSTDVVPVSDHEIAIAAGCLTRKGKIEFESIRPTSWLAPDEKIVAYGPLDGNDPTAVFQGVRLNPSDKKIIRAYLKAKPGDKLNLASGEINRLRSLGSSGDLRKDAEQVTGVLRSILQSRYNSYLNRGLNGIAPYDRGRGKETRPGKLLQTSFTNAKYLKRMIPEAYEAMSRYPAKDSSTMGHAYYWVGLNLEDVPTFALVHQFDYHSQGMDMELKRVYFATNTLDAAQTVTARVPVSEGVLFVYVSRVWTEKVKGFGGTLKRAVAHDLLSREMENIVEGMDICR